jgi:hypothetical protein
MPCPLSGSDLFVIYVAYWRNGEVAECALRVRLLSHNRPIRVAGDG